MREDSHGAVIHGYGLLASLGSRRVLRDLRINDVLFKLLGLLQLSILFCILCHLVQHA